MDESPPLKVLDPVKVWVPVNLFAPLNVDESPSKVDEAAPDSEVRNPESLVNCEVLMDEVAKP